MFSPYSSSSSSSRSILSNPSTLCSTARCIARYGVWYLAAVYTLTPWAFSRLPITRQANPCTRNLFTLSLVNRRKDRTIPQGRAPYLVAAAFAAWFLSLLAHLEPRQYGPPRQYNLARVITYLQLTNYPTPRRPKAGAEAEMEACPQCATIVPWGSTAWIGTDQDELASHFSTAPASRRTMPTCTPRYEFVASWYGGDVPLRGRRSASSATA